MVMILNHIDSFDINYELVLRHRVTNQIEVLVLIHHDCFDLAFSIVDLIRIILLREAILRITSTCVNDLELRFVQVELCDVLNNLFVA